MPLARYKSNSFKRVNRVTKAKRNVEHYRRGKKSLPHCALCRTELNGISRSRQGGKSRRTNSRLFGGILCANCTAEIVTMGSRIERGELKLDGIGIRQRGYVLQLISH